MSAFTFRPAVRESVGLIIGLAGPSGGGKTYTAMELATGLAGGRRFAVIDTEGGRAKHYADRFDFDHGDLKPPFRPSAYSDAIKAADAAGYPVVVVDSMSHEWAGEGGILDWQDEEHARMGRREAAKMASWIAPKMAHKKMVGTLLQLRAHIILCFRAEEKIDMVDDPDKPGKKKIVPKVGRAGFRGWLPICEKNLPFELTTTILLLDDAPGVPIPLKIEEQHRAIFPTDRPITREAGVALAAWAAGGAAPRVVPEEDAELERLRAVALKGMEAFKPAWRALPAATQARLRPLHFAALRAAAMAADEGPEEPPEEPEPPPVRDDGTGGAPDFD